MMKEGKGSWGAWGFPCLLIVMLGAILGALAVISFNRVSVRQMGELQGTIESQRREVLSLNERLASLKEQETVVQGKIDAADAAIKTRDEALAELTRKRAESEEIIAKAGEVERREKAAKDALMESEAAILTAKANESAALQAARVATAAKTKVAADIERTTAELKQLRDEQSKLAGVKLEVEQARQNLALLQGEVKAAETRLASARESLTATEEQARATVSTQEVALASLKAEVAALSESRQSLLAKVAAVKKELETNDAALSEGKIRLEGMKSERNRVAQETAELEGDLRDLKVRQSAAGLAFETQIADLGKKKAEADAALAKVAEEIKTRQKAADDAQEASRAALSESRVKLEGVKSERERILREKHDLEVALREEKERKIAEIESLKAQIDDLSKRKTKLAADILAFQSSMAATNYW